MKIEEKFPGDDHRQVYYACREYPRAMLISFACGAALSGLFSMFVIVVFG